MKRELINWFDFGGKMSTAMNVNKFWSFFCNELIYKSISVDFFMVGSSIIWGKGEF